MKNVRYILSAALALAGFASCGDENMVSETAESQQGKQQMMTFTVNAPNVGDTRSQLDENGKSVVFNADDAINVFIDYDTQFKFTTSEGGSVATFTGTADAADQYYFLSPYQSTAKGNRGTVYANLPSVQQAVSGSYDPNAMISVGEGTNTDPITLRQACALIKIKIAETLDGVQRIYLNGDEPLAGILYITTNTGVIDYISEKEYQIALDGPFTSGSTYYICVPPQSLGKLTVSYTTATAVYERTAVNPLTAEAGHIYDFGEIDNTNYSISTQARLLKNPSFGKSSRDCVTKIHIECEYAGVLPAAEVSDECRIVGGIGNNTIWEVYDRNSNTLYIQTKASSILMPSSSGDFFRNYEYVTTITGLDKLDTRNVVSMYDMFYGCKWLTDVSGITNWDVSNVQRLNAMFRDCQRLEALDLSGWNTRSLAHMTDMFMNCYMLSALKLGENFTLNSIEQKRWMFSDASRDTANGLTIYGVADDDVKAKLKDDTDWDDARMKFSGPIAGVAKRTGDIDVKWVQLWENGPKWAEYNVGVADGKAESKGGYWRGAENPTTQWGSNWRMPTKSEFEALINAENCESTYITVNGNRCLKITGKGAYSSNSVLFPAGGYIDNGQSSASRDNEFGRYWTSSPASGSNLWCMGYGDDDSAPFVSEGGSYFQHSVRAVLAE